MINIIKKEDCCGCGACVQRCPKQCITMKEDNEGFLYPTVDAEICIDCGLCEKVCPFIKQASPQQPLKVYAAYNKDEEIRMQSSSGGIFTLLAEETINKNGVVFGVKFNKEWMPEFDYTETTEGIAPFRGSKYVQAIVGNAYKQAEEFLKAGREVLFCGTPCQIAGLKRFLRKEYDNLLTVDIICHGVPSPKVWDIYIKEIYNKLSKNIPDEKNQSVSPIGETYKSCIEAISFRSKITGWKKYSFLLKLNFSTCDGKNTVVFTETFIKNHFMQAMLEDFTLRPSCHSCKCKNGKSHSDITIGDFWGISDSNPDLDDNKGISATLINSQKGYVFFEQVENKINIETDLDKVKAHNMAYQETCKKSILRSLFFKKINKKKSFTNTVEYCTHPPIHRRIINKISRAINNIKE